MSLVFSYIGTQIASPAKPPALAFTLCPIASLALGYCSSPSLWCAASCAELPASMRGNILAFAHAADGVGSKTGCSLKGCVAQTGLWPFGKCLSSGHSGCGRHGVKWPCQLKCAKLSWWQSTDLIFGMIPLSCGDHLLKSCFLLSSCTEGNPTSWRNILPLVIIKKKKLQLASPERGETVRRRDACVCIEWPTEFISVTPLLPDQHRASWNLIFLSFFFLAVLFCGAGNSQQHKQASAVRWPSALLEIGISRVTWRMCLPSVVSSAALRLLNVFWGRVFPPPPHSCFLDAGSRAGTPRVRFVDGCCSALNQGGGVGSVES